MKKSIPIRIQLMDHWSHTLHPTPTTPLLPPPTTRRFKTSEYRNIIITIYGVVVSMFDFHRSDRGSNPGLGDKIS